MEGDHGQTRKANQDRNPSIRWVELCILECKNESILQDQGVGVWKAVVNRYNVPAIPPTDQAPKKLYEDNSKAMNAILSSLVETIFVKVMHCETAKEIWDKLKNIY